MKAWQVREYGEPAQVLVREEIPEPEPNKQELLLRVLAAPANFADVLLCRGSYQAKPELPFTPGIEVCGIVEPGGSAGERFKVGERVLALTALPDGSFADMCIVRAGAAFAPPPHVSNADASCMCVTYLTALFSLGRRASLQAGETLVVHAASGGVGSAAVKIGRAFGAMVIAVTSGATKAASVRGLGADVVVDREIEDFVQVVRDVTAGRGADVIFDPVGGSTFDRSTTCIAFEGRIVVVGFAGGVVSKPRMSEVLNGNFSVHGVFYGDYPGRNSELVERGIADLDTMIESGSLRTGFGPLRPFNEVAASLQELAEGAITGRVVFDSSA